MHLRKLESLNPNLSQTARDTLALLEDCGKPPSILVACDANATIQFMFNGNFPLARLSLTSLIENDDQNHFSLGAQSSIESVKVKKMQLSGDWAELGVLATIQTSFQA